MIGSNIVSISLVSVEMVISEYSAINAEEIQIVIYIYIYIYYYIHIHLYILVPVWYVKIKKYIPSNVYIYKVRYIYIYIYDLKCMGSFLGTYDITVESHFRKSSAENLVVHVSCLSNSCIESRGPVVGRLEPQKQTLKFTSNPLILSFAPRMQKLAGRRSCDKE